jgi:hypothetical protein
VADLVRRNLHRWSPIILSTYGVILEKSVLDNILYDLIILSALFYAASRPVRGSPSLLSNGIPGALSLVVKLHIVPRTRMRGAIPPLRPHGVILSKSTGTTYWFCILGLKYEFMTFRNRFRLYFCPFQSTRLQVAIHMVPSMNWMKFKRTWHMRLTVNIMTLTKSHDSACWKSQ